jgi:hypothetical protein
MARFNRQHALNRHAALNRTVPPCPHCGNMDSQFREDNNDRLDLTYLCIAPVRPEDSTTPDCYTHLVGTGNKVPCGMQWEPKRCEWFARCTREATQTIPHPIGDVPACDRCAALARGD